MKKTARPSPLADLAHKGFVWTCLGLTAYGFYLGSTRFYSYWTVTRPARLAAKEKLIKEEDNEELRA